MTVYEHEVHLIVKFQTTRKLRSRTEVIRIAQILEHSCLNKTSEVGVIYARRTNTISKKNVIEK